MITINVKLGSAIIRFRPEGHSNNPFQMELDEGCSLTDAVVALGMPADLRLMSILNDTLITPEQRENTVLCAGDSLALMPPIQAG